MSRILGQSLSNVSGGGQQISQPSALASAIQQILEGNTRTANGLDDLISRFQTAGLGQQIQSWTWTGQNQAISPNDLMNAFPQMTSSPRMTSSPGRSRLERAPIHCCKYLPRLRRTRWITSLRTARCQA